MIRTVSQPAHETGIQPEGTLEFYKSLTSRNFHFVPAPVQKQLSRLKILIAGCGSTGGACIEPLARLGMTRFHLADNGNYEVSNLNRQHARISAVGKNKAQFHAEELLEINPYAEVKVFPEGLTSENIELAVQGVDLVMDAVDVTTTSGMAMKIALHEICARKRIPTFSALDLGYRQWGRSYDYRDPRLLPLDGKIEKAMAKSHPISALFTLFPLSCVPNHALPLLDDLLENRSEFASQLGATSDLLSSIIVAALVRFAESGQLVEGWSIDLWELRKSSGRTWTDKIRSHLKAVKLRRSIRRRIRGDIAIAPKE